MTHTGLNLLLSTSHTHTHTLTSPQEQHLVVPIRGRHLVHGDGGELVVHVGADHQGALVHRVHGVVHGGVVPHEVDDLVRVVLGGLHVGGERATGTLRPGPEDMESLMDNPFVCVESFHYYVVYTFLCVCSL